MLPLRDLIDGMGYAAIMPMRGTKRGHTLERRPSHPRCASQLTHALRASQPTTPALHKANATFIRPR